MCSYDPAIIPLPNTVHANICYRFKIHINIILPLPVIFRFLLSAILARVLYGLTSIGQTGSTCHVKCKFMYENDKAVPPRARDGAHKMTVNSSVTS